MCGITNTSHTSNGIGKSLGRRLNHWPTRSSSAARARAGAGKYLCVLRLHGFAASRTRNAAVAHPERFYVLAPADDGRTVLRFVAPGRNGGVDIGDLEDFLLRHAP